jgi:SAM-dependent methyltransferase
MHEAVIEYVSREIAARDLNRDKYTVLDLGGRDINGTTRQLFNNVASYVSVDIADGLGVDIVADAADLNLDERFDVVVSTELLEHTERADEIVAAAARHLKPGGVFVATMAGPGRTPHGAAGEPSPNPGEWYCNVSPDELEEWLAAAGFDKWEIDQSGLDLRCTATVKARKPRPAPVEAAVNKPPERAVKPKPRKR